MSTVIMAAVTLAIVISASLWSGQLASLFTRFEKIEIQSAYVIYRDGDYVVNIRYVNTGSSSTSIDAVFLNGVPYSQYNPVSKLSGDLIYLPSACKQGISRTGTITVRAGAADPGGNRLAPGVALAVNLHTTGGKTYSTTVLLTGGVEPTVNGASLTGRGLNYLSLYHFYSGEHTSDYVLRRDFTRFRQDGINVISLSLYWYRLEGNSKGSYNDTFLGDVKRVIGIAHECGIEVLVTFHTLWGSDSTWCTPDYVIDPVSGENIGLAIVRSEEMKGAFVDVVDHTVRYLAGTPGIWAWALLNEPWYWPHELDPPFDGIDQKGNFIDLIQKLSAVVRNLDGRPTTIRFASSTNDKNIFVDDWGWDQRIFDALDFISFNAYIPTNPALLDAWKSITGTNVLGSADRGKRVWITEFGYDSDDEATQLNNLKLTLEFFTTLPINGWMAWYWRSDAAPAGWDENPGQIGKGMNLCASADGTPRPAYSAITQYAPRE